MLQSFKDRMCSNSCSHQLLAATGQGRDGYAERTAQLFRVAGLLKKYADMYKIAVVVTNQVKGP